MLIFAYQFKSFYKYVKVKVKPSNYGDLLKKIRLVCEKYFYVAKRSVLPWKTIPKVSTFGKGF